MKAEAPRTDANLHECENRHVCRSARLCLQLCLCWWREIARIATCTAATAPHCTIGGARCCEACEKCGASTQQTHITLTLLSTNEMNHVAGEIAANIENRCWVGDHKRRHRCAVQTHCNDNGSTRTPQSDG